MSEFRPNEFLELATRLAAQAKQIAIANFGQVQASLKPDNTVVTQIDHEIQAMILDEIAGVFPDHGVIAEETIREANAHADARSARFCWVVDPLDGTRNYASGFACFATSIAVLDRGKPIVAVVVEHNIGAVYTAVSGGGTYVNGRRIHAIDPPPGNDLVVGVPSSKDELSVSVVREWSATKGLICRNLGSAAYHLALVASSAFAATFCKQCKIWDIAAGILLVEEAGGLVTDERGEEISLLRADYDSFQDLPVLAGSLQAHSRLISMISVNRPGVAR